MDGDAIGRWLKGIGLGFVLALLASMLSFDLFDPTFSNLRQPEHGVANAMGLPGALLGGSLVELLGASALWVPALLLVWMGLPKTQRDWRRQLAHGTVTVLASAALHGLLSGRVPPGLGAPGLAGLAGGRWIAETTGPVLGAALLLPALAYALTQLLRFPVLGAAAGDLATFTRFFARKGGAALARFRSRLRVRVAHLPESWAGWRQAAAEGGSRLRGALPGGRGAAYLAGAGRHAGKRRGRGAGAMRQGTKSATRRNRDEDDGFNAWISAIADPADPPEQESAEKP